MKLNLLFVKYLFSFKYFDFKMISVWISSSESTCLVLNKAFRPESSPNGLQEVIQKALWCCFSLKCQRFFSNGRDKLSFVLSDSTIDNQTPSAMFNNSNAGRIPSISSHLLKKICFSSSLREQTILSKTFKMIANIFTKLIRRNWNNFKPIFDEFMWFFFQS